MVKDNNIHIPQIICLGCLMAAFILIVVCVILNR